MTKPDITGTAPGATTAQALTKGSTRMKPKDVFHKVSTGIHRAAFNASKGRLFGKAFEMPVVELVTTGRRSGKERSTMRSEEHTSELHANISYAVFCLKKKQKQMTDYCN